MLRISRWSTVTGKKPTPVDLLFQGIIYNDKPPDGQIVGWSGYQKQGISSKWPRLSNILTMLGVTAAIGILNAIDPMSDTLNRDA